MKQSVYPILDIETCRKRGLDPVQMVAPWLDLGLNIFQLRWKNAQESEYLNLAQEITGLFPEAVLIANDYARIARGNFPVVHVGQEDWSREKEFLVATQMPFGISTHSPAQLKAALELSPGPAYIALGPVRLTGSKPAGTDPVLTPEELDEAAGLFARAVRPCGFVLIGGINAGNAAEILLPLARAHGIIPAVALIQGALDTEGLRRILEITNGLPGRPVGLERSLTRPGAT